MNKLGLLALTDSQKRIQACVQEWQIKLPIGHVLDEAASAPYLENCLGLERRIVALLRPETESEVITIVGIANAHKIPLYAYSGGNNWGYGSRLPPVDGCALVDLSRMNKIRDFDAELGLVTIEPGVTQQQLLEFLTSHHHAFYVPTTGMGPTGSLVGNALERGFGITPDEDHFRAVTSLRAVLADGRIYQSAFDEMGAPTAGVWKWGVGPYLDGIFAQGNMGIVTAMQLALVDHAEHVEIFSIAPRRGKTLTDLLAASKTLLTDMRGGLQGIKIFNEYQIRNTLGQPYTQIPPEAANRWQGLGVFRCRKSMLSNMRREIRRTLSPQARLIFMNERRHRLLSKLLPLIPGRILKDKMRGARYVLDISSGIPRADGLQLVYSYIAPSTVPPRDPVADGVGIIWYAPVLPLKPQRIAEMIETIQSILEKHERLPLISFTTVNEKCAIGVIPILYRQPDEADAAHACYRELVEKGNALGCPIYRTHVGAMEKLTGDPDSVHWDSVARIKQALDPNHIFSPGRYCPVSPAL